MPTSPRTQHNNLTTLGPGGIHYYLPMSPSSRFPQNRQRQADLQAHFRFVYKQRQLIHLTHTSYLLQGVNNILGGYIFNSADTGCHSADGTRRITSSWLAEEVGHDHVIL